MDARQDTRSRQSSTAVPAASAMSERGHRCGEGLLDPAQAARYLGTSERHLRRLWQEGRLSAVKIGRRVRFTRRDLDSFIEANRHRAVR
jgi:excisionase family DNA binding protein